MIGRKAPRLKPDETQLVSELSAPGRLDDGLFAQACAVLNQIVTLNP